MGNVFGFFVVLFSKPGFPPLHAHSGLLLQIVQKSWAKHIDLLLILTSVSCPNRFIIVTLECSGLFAFHFTLERRWGHLLRRKEMLVKQELSEFPNSFKKPCKMGDT